jgi:ubiquinone/menaquinone biosynthesis C-methylase UbiE
MDRDYSAVTELPGHRVSREQLERILHRYRLAAEFSSGKDVLEVACGAGLGLGVLSERAHGVTAIDIEPKNLNHAKRRYADKKNVDLRLMDAENLLFPDGSFDIVILFEAIYYLNDPRRFVREAARVLKNPGFLIMCTVNREWEDFNPSAYSRGYFSADEIRMLLDGVFKTTRIYGAFPAGPATGMDAAIGALKKAAVKMNVIPKTMKSKEILKRIFFGRLIELGGQINFEDYGFEMPVELNAPGKSGDYKIIYSVSAK